MAKYSKGQIDKAGKTLKNANVFDGNEVREAQDILTYWRYVHTPVINGFQAMLRNKISGAYKKNGFIAQRLKRTPSILYKLNREPGMLLCRMQDIAGIRAVMKKLTDVKLLADDLITSRHKHKLIPQTDYIFNAKESGYRGIHLIFEYNNSKQADSVGLRIEVQIRTQLQHTWATAVETLGIFLNISLKSGEGDPQILEFLALSSSAFATIEKCPVLKKHENYVSPIHLYKDVIKWYDNLKIADKLGAYSVAATELPKINKGRYFLLTLDTVSKNIDVVAYGNKDYDSANKDYTKKEIEISIDSTKEVVLVSIDKISALRKAYPNYFLDATAFIGKMEALREIISKNVGKIQQLSLFDLSLDQE